MTGGLTCQEIRERLDRIYLTVEGVAAYCGRGSVIAGTDGSVLPMADFGPVLDEINGLALDLQTLAVA